MKRLTANLILLVILAGFYSCKKDGADSIAVQSKISLNIHCVHHSWDVPYMNVYLKKNCTTYPGNDTTLYDLKAEGDVYGKTTFSNLLPGNYYIFATGYDPTWGANTIGYKGVILSNENLTDNQLSVTLYIS